ncbi:MAG: MarR family transcriptional regulator [Parvularculaceae bacterium]|nr:MarR family transcriptional regulator [Parvularculaceae bacterium]
MTEISDTFGGSAALQGFVLQWGDLGGAWGVSRSVAQIHAALLVSEKPLTAEDIALSLGMARSNVSTSLRELVQWGLARRAPAFGDRRDFFEAEADVWEMMARIAAMRKAREFDPAVAALARCLEKAKQEAGVPPAALRRLGELQDLVSTLNDWWGQISGVPKNQLLPLIRLGAKAVDLLKPFSKGKPKGTGP